MTRSRGRALGGLRLLAHAPHGHYPTNTLIAAIRLDGPFAPCLFDGPMDGELFLTWVCQQLAPCLREGDIAIIDNLATHNVSGVRQAIESAGASLLYLPAYSPDFNPIEPMWGKIKACMRGLGPRTEEELFAAFAHAIETVTPSDCKGFFSHAKYDT